MKRIFVAIFLALLTSSSYAQFASSTRFHPPQAVIPTWKVIQFELTPDRMETLFSSRYEFDPPNANVCKLPRLIIASRAAGDAYTVGATEDFLIESGSAGIWGLIETTGFLTVTTEQTRGRILPHSASSVLYPDTCNGTPHDGFYLHIRDGEIVKGAASPNLKIKLYYEEYPPGWF